MINPVLKINNPKSNDLMKKLFILDNSGNFLFSTTEGSSIRELEIKDDQFLKKISPFIHYFRNTSKRENIIYFDKTLILISYHSTLTMIQKSESHFSELSTKEFTSNLETFNLQSKALFNFISFLTPPFLLYTGSPILEYVSEASALFLSHFPYSLSLSLQAPLSFKKGMKSPKVLKSVSKIRNTVLKGRLGAEKGIAFFSLLQLYPLNLGSSKYTSKTLCSLKPEHGATILEDCLVQSFLSFKIHRGKARNAFIPSLSAEERSNIIYFSSVLLGRNKASAVFPIYLPSVDKDRFCNLIAFKNELFTAPKDSACTEDKTEICSRDASLEGLPLGSKENPSKRADFLNKSFNGFASVYITLSSFSFSKIEKAQSKLFSLLKELDKPSVQTFSEPLISLSKLHPNVIYYCEVDIQANSIRKLSFLQYGEAKEEIYDAVKILIEKVSLCVFLNGAKLFKTEREERFLLGRVKILIVKKSKWVLGSIGYGALDRRTLKDFNKELS